MTKTTETRIKKITPWIFSDSNERFSHLEIYFRREGRTSYRGTRGTKEQIIEQLCLDNNKSFESNVDSLIGKKVRITKDLRTGWICDMQLLQPVQGSLYKSSLKAISNKAAGFIFP